VRNTVAESRNLCAHEGKTGTDRLHLQVSGIRKIVANIFRKPLDKTYIVWYNISVKERYYLWLVRGFVLAYAI